MSIPVRKNSSKKSSKFNKSINASKSGNASENSNSRTSGVDDKIDETADVIGKVDKIKIDEMDKVLNRNIDKIDQRINDRIDERIPDPPVTVFKKISAMDKIQNSGKGRGKGATKRNLLEKIRLSIKNKTGYFPSLNEAIICSSQSYLQDLRLNKQQTSKIELAASASKMTSAQILDKACAWAARFYSKKYSNKYVNESIDAKINRGRGDNSGADTGAGKLDQFSAGSAYLRIHEFVTALIKKNDLAKKKEHKVFINQTYLAKHQGSNRDAIKGYLQLHADMLDKHHRKHDLNPRHNLEVNTYFGKIGKGAKEGNKGNEGK